MNLFLTLIRFALFCLSTAGYAMLLMYRLKASGHAAWVVSLSGISLAVYVAGLCNVLSEVSQIVFFFGCVLAVNYIVTREKNRLFSFSHVNLLNLGFALMVGILFASLYHFKLLHYDDFSHWGLSVKTLLVTHTFPGAETALIDFKTYPLGSTSFLYYFCTVVGHSQGVMLIGQAMLILSCFYAMFGVVRDFRRLMLSACLATLLSFMSFFNKSIRIDTLLVDFLLPVLALAACAVMLEFRHRIGKACLFSAPLVGLLAITKSAGLFFAAICYGFLLLLALRGKGFSLRFRRVCMALLCIVLSLLPFMAWEFHTGAEMVETQSKHTMSLTNFTQVYGEKTPEITQEIVTSYWAAVFSSGGQTFMAVAGLNAACLLTWFLARVLLKRKWRLLRCLICLDVALALYVAGVLAMYLFTMPTAEALILAGLERYLSSMVIFVLGMLALCLTMDLEDSLHVQMGTARDVRAYKSIITKSLYQNATLFFLCVLSLLLISEINEMTATRQPYESSLPGRVEALAGDQWELSDRRYLLLATDTNRQISDYYVQYIGRYFLFSPHVDASGETDPQALSQMAKQYDYIVVVETGDLEKAHPEVIWQEALMPADLFARQLSPD